MQTGELLANSLARTDHLVLLIRTSTVLLDGNGIIFPLSLLSLQLKFDMKKTTKNMGHTEIMHNHITAIPMLVLFKCKKIIMRV